MSARGVITIHSAPSAMCRHVEWAVGGVLGVPVSMDWTDQPAERGSYRAEMTWSGPDGTAGRLASAFAGWKRLRFEVTEDGGKASERYSYTPELGIFRADTGPHGDVMVHEDRLKKALAEDALGLRQLGVSLVELLGSQWDDELEVFRHAGEGAPVRWLGRGRGVNPRRSE